RRARDADRAVSDLRRDCGAGELGRGNGAGVNRPARRDRGRRRTGPSSGGEVVAVEGRELDRLVLEVPVKEADGERREVLAVRELRAARVVARLHGKRERVGQDVTAVVTDEDALRTRVRGECGRPVLESLVEREQLVGDALTEQHRYVDVT